MEKLEKLKQYTEYLKEINKHYRYIGYRYCLAVKYDKTRKKKMPALIDKCNKFIESKCKDKKALKIKMEIVGTWLVVSIADEFKDALSKAKFYFTDYDNHVWDLLHEDEQVREGANSVFKEVCNTAINPTVKTMHTILRYITKAVSPNSHKFKNFITIVNRKEK